MSIKINPIFWSFLIVFSTLCCKNASVNSSSTASNLGITDFSNPYLFDRPDESFYLDRKLTEISGLSYSTLSKSLLAVNDEQGIVFYISPEDGKTTDLIEFGKPGDYEGICSHNGQIYITESNGNVSKVEESNGSLLKKYKGILTRSQDVEGLCYSKTMDAFLLAAKGDSRVKGKSKSTKSIFIMDIPSGNISADPFLSINLLDASKKLLDDHGTIDKHTAKRIKKFAPSAIAEHPISGDLYILSAKGSLIVILGSDKQFKSITLLDPNLHEQPEGICFDTDATLYLSNEGKARQAVIYKYKML